MAEVITIVVSGAVGAILFRYVQSIIAPYVAARQWDKFHRSKGDK